MSPKSPVMFQSLRIIGKQQLQRFFSGKPFAGKVRTENDTPLNGSTHDISNKFGSLETKVLEEQSEPKKKKELSRRILHVRHVTRVTSGDKVRNVSAIVVVGDMDGMAGYGQGRGPNVAKAVAKGNLFLSLPASRLAREKMMPIPRLDKRTVWSDVKCKFGDVDLSLWTARPGVLQNLYNLCSMG